uniref:Ig-like domain-containing protein n=1 Tax=Gadus morhua TaxID=8049 RepID=A0A8C5FSQ0_GADMO
MLKVDQSSPLVMASVAWTFNLANGTVIPILTSAVETITAPEYINRTKFDSITGSLELSSLTLDDTGLYEVMMIPPWGHPLPGECNLQVQVRVSGVTVTPNTTELLEFSSSVRISCHVSTGTSLSYLWMNGSSEITVSSDRVQVGDGGTSLTILNVTRYDRGPYTCNVSNLISTQESAPLTLHPIYGPVSIQIYVQVDQVQIGQVLHLSCRAESTPPADFTWMNGMNEEIGSGADFQKTATLLDSGEYTCLAVNSITKLELRAVQKAISNVELKTNDTVFVEFRDSAVFTCSAKGSSPSFLWMNGSSMVTVGNWVQIGAGGSTLTILNMTRYDQGPLTCNVSNSVSNFILPSPNISDFLLGSDLNVSCSAQSNPHAQLKWAFQGDRLTTTGPELKLHSVSEKDSGLYSCLAYNNVTQLYSNITKSINIGRNLCNLCICISI